MDSRSPRRAYSSGKPVITVCTFPKATSLASRSAALRSSRRRISASRRRSHFDSMASSKRSSSPFVTTASCDVRGSEERQPQRDEQDAAEGDAESGEHEQDDGDYEQDDGGV